MMRTKLVAIAIVGVVALTATARAATLTDSKGTVLVNVGQGFQSAAPAQALPAGAQVMVNAGGGAKLAYADACIVRIVPGHVYSVAAQSPCVGRSNLGACGANGKDETGENCDPNNTANTTTPTQGIQALSATDIALGLGVVVAIGAGAYLLSQDNKSSP